MKPILFPEPTTPHTRALGWTEPAVHWFTESTRPEAVASRANVNAWYVEFPDADGKFAARLRSDVDVDHYQALDELFVHQLMHQRFDDVRYEEGGVGPDFRAYEGGERAASVEVVSLFQRADWSDKERPHRRLADELNARVPPAAGYFVDFEIERADRDPPPRRVADFVHRQLDQLPPPEQLLLPDQPTRADLPSAVYDEDGVRITVSFIPMKADAEARTSPNGRIVGMGPMIGGMVNTASRLRDRVESKAGGRYDIADAPFLITVGLHDFVGDDHDVLEALYGGEAVVVETGRLVRNSDGVFGADRERPEGRHRRVSAVAVITALRPWEPEQADVAVLHNPYASNGWPDDALPATRRFGPAADDGSPVRFDWTESHTDAVEP